MSEKRSSSDEGNPVENQVVIDALRDDAIRMVDEAGKVQPLLAHSISKLHFDYLETAKSLIETSFSSQKQVFSMLNVPTFIQHEIPPEQVSKQSAELANNAVRTFGLLHALAINVLDTHRENLKIYSRTVDAAIKNNIDALKTGASYWTPFVFR